jgi:hypothetical protein
VKKHRRAPISRPASEQSTHKERRAEQPDINQSKQTEKNSRGRGTNRNTTTNRKQTDEEGETNINGVTEGSAGSEEEREREREVCTTNEIDNGEIHRKKRQNQTESNGQQQEQ